MEQSISEMKTRTCDNWVLMTKGRRKLVLTGTSGGYVIGDRWRCSSYLIHGEEDNTHFYFYTQSGSTYICRKDSEQLRMNAMAPVKALEDQGWKETPTETMEEVWIQKRLI